MFACVFGSTLEKDKVISSSLWSIKGNILVIQQWTPNLAIDEVYFRYSPFWIQVHHIPLNRINMDNASRFRNYIGSFIKADKGLGENRVRGFLRFQVQVDTTKPLKLVCLYKMMTVLLDGSQTSVSAAGSWGMSKCSAMINLCHHREWKTQEQRLVLGSELGTTISLGIIGVRRTKNREKNKRRWWGQVSQKTHALLYIQPVHSKITNLNVR